MSSNCHVLAFQDCTEFNIQEQIACLGFDFCLISIVPPGTGWLSVRGFGFIFSLLFPSVSIYGVCTTGGFLLFPKKEIFTFFTTG